MRKRRGETQEDTALTHVWHGCGYFWTQMFELYISLISPSLGEIKMLCDLPETHHPFTGWRGRERGKKGSCSTWKQTQSEVRKTQSESLMSSARCVAMLSVLREGDRPFLSVCVHTVSPVLVTLVHQYRAN